jgi:hypothetical protein
MKFKISEARLEELSQIEADCNCEIGAALDVGGNADRFQAGYLPPAPIDETRLLGFLQGELSDRLSTEQIVTLANDLQIQVQQQISARKVA